MAAVQMERMGIPYRGVDLPITKRPGVPKETPAHPLPGTHWATPERQTATVPVLKGADFPELSPVFGTSVPPRGLSGKIRRLAYTIPDHFARHWVLLRAADRVDVIENNLGGFVLRALPVIVLATAAGAWRARRRRSRRRWFSRR